MGGDVTSSVVSVTGLDGSLSQRRAALEKRRRRRWLRVWSVVGVLALAGAVWGWRERVAVEAWHATSVRVEARSGDLESPAVVWPRGLPDHGRWQDDPWVAAMREFEVVYAAAYNTGRLNGRADLLDVLAPWGITVEDGLDQWQDDLTREWERALDEGREIPVMPGPAVFEVLDVVVDASGGSAVVEACADMVVSWISADSPEQIMSGAQGRRVEWDLVRATDDRIRYVGPSWGSSCEFSDPHYGVFDPQPVRPTEVPVVERWQRPQSEGRSVDIEELLRRYEELRDMAAKAAQG